MSLISVSNKENLSVISNFLLSKNKTIISTGGTFEYIFKNANEEFHHNIKSVYQITGFPEILNGRVKTLHPLISGALLAKKHDTEHASQMNKYNIPNIDIVIVNLYPFQETIRKKNVTQEDAIENIDIGGHTLIRESAKNYNDILIIVDPNDYTDVIDNYENIDMDFRFKYAKKAFSHVTAYDISINNFYNVGETSDIFRHYSKQYDLKYGCNPHQSNSAIYKINDSDVPIDIINGKLGYINIIDALNSWQLVKELKESLGISAAASFKHTSPAGVGTSVILSDELKQLYNVANVELTPLATAFIRARYTDPMSSFGDFIALSDKVDLTTAKLIKKEVSDGIIAPDFDPDALEILMKKKNGNYLIIKVNGGYSNDGCDICDSKPLKVREMFGMCISEEPNSYQTTINSLTDIKTDNKLLNPNCMRDLIIANVSLKYAQSNNVAYAYNGQLLGLAAGQQNRVDSVRLAGEKAKLWMLMHHPKVGKLRKLFKDDCKRQDKTNGCIRFIQGNMTDIEYKYWCLLFKSVDDIPEKITEEEAQSFIKEKYNLICMASDAFFPFRDSIDIASQYGVKYILQPGGSIADKSVIEACNEYSMIMSFSGARMFYH